MLFFADPFKQTNYFMSDANLMAQDGKSTYLGIIANSYDGDSKVNFFWNMEMSSAQCPFRVNTQLLVEYPVFIPHLINPLVNCQ